MNEQKICADVMAFCDGKLVLIERLSEPKGFALPGGKQEPDESLSETAKREFGEETGMELAILSVLGTYADPTRDPRGRYISTVFIGRASGNPRNENGKTRVVLVEKADLPRYEKLFVCDHARMLNDYLRLNLNQKGRRQ